MFLTTEEKTFYPHEYDYEDLEDYIVGEEEEEDEVITTQGLDYYLEEEEENKEEEEEYCPFSDIFLYLK